MLLELLLRILLLALQIVLREVAALAQAVGVVRPGLVLACVGHTALALPVVAAVTHVLRIMLLVQVVAQKVVLHINCGILAEHTLDLPPLEVAHRVLAELASQFAVRARRLLLGRLRLRHRLLGLLDVG